MRKLLVSFLLVASACSKDSPTPPVSPSVTQPIATPSTPAPIVLTGRLTATVTGEPLANEAVKIGDKQTTTDAAGGFRLEFTVGSVSPAPLVTITGPDMVTRETQLLLLASREFAADAISLKSGFDRTFYQQMVRNAYSDPASLRTLRRWTTAPKVYLKTVDEAGKPMEAETLDAVEGALRDSAPDFTGGRFGLATVERGGQTREGQTGWITVRFPSQPEPGLCGRAQVATDGGWIELYYRSNCSAPCSHSRVAPMVVRHELGHALGFWHVSERRALMWGGGWDGSECNIRANDKEKFHAAVAYSRPPGNHEPDSDVTSTSTLRFEPPPVVDN